MSIPGAANPLLLATAAAGGYSISRSLRFNSADSAYLSRTPASAGNRKTWTWAGWVKRSAITSNDFTLFSAYSDNNTRDVIAFPGSGSGYNADGIQYFTISGGSFVAHLVTTPVYRDPSAWMHVVVARDTTQATSTNRVKIYVNGAQVTTFSTSTYPAQNNDAAVNNTLTHDIGAQYFNNRVAFFNGYLADIHFCDGTAYDASAFGEFDANGIWQPKKFAGVYGSQGWKLDFSDNSAATAAALGKDTSGNGLNWTPSNLSVTAGAGNDSLVDVPINGAQTDTGVGGEVRGNYATWNPTLHSLNGNKPNLSNGNLDQGGNISSLGSFGLATILPGSGKWYMEVTMANANFGAGIWKTPLSPSLYAYQQTNFRYFGDGGVYNASGSVATYSTFTTGDVIGVALDIDNGKVFFSKNGTWQGSSDPAAGTNPAGSSGIDGTWTFGLQSTDSATGTCNVNFGQRSWAYQAPSGFKALCTANLPAPVVTKPSTVMDVALYTGTGSSQSITGLGFSPDLVWIKNRTDSGSSHALFDAVRGTDKRLRSNGTDAELSPAIYGSLTAFNSNGFTVAPGSDPTDPAIETCKSSKAYVGWCWDAGSSTVTNTQGSISSQVRANASAGFSIVTYTGNGSSAQTVGHGLGAKPGLIIVKSRSNGTWNWGVYHSSLTGSTPLLVLNGTGAAINIYNAFNPANNTSSVFGIGNEVTTNESSGTYVAYCFAPVDGYSSFGSYTGNGSADGPFVYTGMRPRYLCIKSTSFSDQWIVFDAARNTSNVVNLHLHPNLSNNEASLDWLDFTSNGFKIRTNYSTVNQSSGSFIYFAFAESPFQYARAR